MNTSMHRAPHGRLPGLARFALLGLLLALAACDKADERSAGEKVDSAIARTQQAATEAAARTEALAREAGAKVKASEPAMQQGLDKIKEAARETGAAVSAGVSDATITASVSAGLAKDPALSATRIDVDTQGGTVTLRGPAPSTEAKARAETIARAVNGVSKVDNQLEVRAM
ncbi:BON domain-containing protein [Variovorax boronicumulans]|uniref:BON domain-containing protein n=1 Tax=Variovorax boronicumulans TaxID=436515 RepID=UPI001C59486D